MQSLRIMRAAKIAAAMFVIGLFLTVSISRLPFTTVSPDSIRFMHFAQINADRAVVEGGTVKTALTATLRTIKGMNNYDLNRGRLVQGLAFGIDGMTRWMLPSGLNLLMVLVLVLNAILAARLATREVEDPKQRLNLGLLACVVLVASSLVLSPVMLVTLYGKYVWIIFVLAHFVARRTGWKVFWLVPAAYSDEIGLFAVALIAFFHVGRAALNRWTVNSDARSDTLTLLRSFAAATAAAVNVILVFFGISAIVFDAGAEAFSSLARRGMKGAIVTGGSAWEIVQGVLWRAEVVLLGLSTKVTAITTILGSVLIVLIAVAIARHFRQAIEGSPNGWSRLRIGIRALVLDRALSFYAYWTVLLVVISWLILPGHVYDLNQYSYPAAIILALLFIRALVDSLAARRAAYVLSGLVALHFALLPRIADETATTITATLLPDSTVSVEDIRKVHRSVEELHATGRSALLDSINNGQEIDFSGTWYYSRVRSFGIATEPHWPVQGTVRVLAWPTHVDFECVRRTFLYTRAEFVDRACPGG